MADCTNCPRSQTEAMGRWVAPRRETPLAGVLNIDKPPGVTSHDVVDAVRRMAGQRKVGHAGTLDPMATGVLLVCLGKATRVAEYLMAGRKCYRATIVLGATTDTYDADGQIVSSGEPVDFTRRQIEAALASFVGQIAQVPPMYSALKHDGQPLHELARQGVTVDRRSRLVEIDELVLLDWTPPSLIVELTCSPGTYVRSLAHDLGQQLGSGAHLASLVRLSSGRFRLEDSVSLERLEQAFRHGQEEEYLLPLDEALLDWPAMVVGTEEASRIAQGQAIPAELQVTEGEEATLCRVYGPDGGFVALLAYHAATKQWRPKKVFVPA